MESNTPSNVKYLQNQVNCVQNELPSVSLIPVTLNSNIEVKALLDSGSVITLIDKKLLPRDTEVYPWQKGAYKVAGNMLTPIGWISARVQVGKIDYIMPQIANGSSNNNRAEITTVVNQYSDIFKTDENDIGQYPDIEIKIELHHDKPIKCKPYRLPEPERKFLKETVNKWIQQKVCRPSESPYAAPMFVVEQRQHSTTPYRPVVDYSRTINPITKVDVQPIERMEDIVNKISEFIFKFKLDIYHAYHNIRIREKDIYKTAVITQDHHVEFMRFMFGLVGGPAVMSKVINSTYGKIYDLGIRMYYDDITGGANTIGDLKNILHQVLTATREKNLKLNKEKCIFITTELPLFGRMVGYKEERPDPKSTIAVQKYTTLSSSTEDDSETIIETDSSYVGMAACLLQIQNGQKKVIEYASRCLKEAETRYHINELEVTAVHWAIVSKFRIFLLGRKFTLITDNYSTAYIINKSKLNRKFARYVIDLAPFDFTPMHRPGKQNFIADHLSRYPLEEICMMVISSNEDKLKLAQGSDNFIKQIISKLKSNENTHNLKHIRESFIEKDGILLHKNEKEAFYKEKIVITQSLWSSIIKIAHDDSGHLDFSTTLERIKMKYWWKTLRQDVKAYTKACMI
ncbi:unnamed protein product [Danaus chrysippus]|uniref:RNA-directed DNA polymerase n=1 Tax=Danaus chrysippus TaxID=151541 RepID=A0A8J2W8Y9_9NEOP|nr:unnamed protein product [Danaus chrysippus]